MGGEGGSDSPAESQGAVAVDGEGKEGTGREGMTRMQRNVEDMVEELKAEVARLTLRYRDVRSC